MKLAEVHLEDDASVAAEVSGAAASLVWYYPIGGDAVGSTTPREKC